MKDAPNIVVRKNEKRPGTARASEPRLKAQADLSWIAHLHELWAIPRTLPAERLSA